MMIAIHEAKGLFSDRWIDYCQQNDIPFKIVDCYRNDITDQLKGCDALMWHHSHMYSRDVVIAKQLLQAVEHSGMVVFPDFKTGWHFDDKLAQKYLLELLEYPVVKTYAFYKKQDALEWAEKTSYPKVFKLRGGGGSWNVFLVNNKQKAIAVIKKAFGRGFKQYDAIANIKDRWEKFRKGNLTLASVLMGVVRIYAEPEYSRVMGKEMGYAYFQDFIPCNDSDIRVIVIDKKAFAIKRMVRNNDFRASGSGEILYNKELFDVNLIKLAFDFTDKIQAQSVAYDFVFDNGNPKLVEISYGFVQKGYDNCPGYWDMEMNWYEGKFDPCSWMVDLVVKQVKVKKNAN